MLPFAEVRYRLGKSVGASRFPFLTLDSFEESSHGTQTMEVVAGPERPFHECALFAEATQDIIFAPGDESSAVFPYDATLSGISCSGSANELHGAIRFFRNFIAVIPIPFQYPRDVRLDFDLLLPLQLLSLSRPFLLDPSLSRHLFLSPTLGLQLRLLSAGGLSAGLFLTSLVFRLPSGLLLSSFGFLT